jgi:2,4-dienoyl-CoA reductase-like NADH-dependent reductase (Old Yellow Enzyme family)
MKSIFEPCSIGHLVLKNRFVRSATGESRATLNGVLTEEVFPIYEKLACGGVGLIITGHMYVDQDWKCGPKQTGIAKKNHIAGLQRLARASRGNGTKVVAQINSAGRRPDEMSRVEIRDVVDRFVTAGSRAQEAGFDGIQIHAAHGFLLSGFLTPSENHRTDAYGCDMEGRRRLLIEIALESRRTLGPQYPILCKLGTVDGRDNSLTLEESVATAKALQEAGIDAIEVSATFSGDHAQAATEGIDKPGKEAYFAPQARIIKQYVHIPIILVGGLRSRDVMQNVVDKGICDMVSMSRPFIREPDLVNRMEAGHVDQASCISCNKCYHPNGFRCVHVSKKI